MVREYVVSCKELFLFDGSLTCRVKSQFIMVREYVVSCKELFLFKRSLTCRVKS